MVQHFIICWGHYHWLLNVNYLLLLHRIIEHILLLLHVYWLWLHYVLHRHYLWLLYVWYLLQWLLLKLLLLLNLLLLLCLSYCFDVFLVCLHVTEEVELGIESPLAVLAIESLIALVDLHMLVQVCLLSESVVAISEFAQVRPL